MALLTSQAILATNDRTFEDVSVPEWGGEVRICSLTGTDRDAFESSMVETKGKDRVVNTQNLRAKLVARAVVDESFARVFSDAQVADLGEKNAAVLDRLFTVAQRLSGMSKEDVETLVGNSDAAPSGDSISDSPSPSAAQ